MAFAKGETGNENGRPKGSYNEDQRKFLELRKKAANDVDAWYDGLVKAREEGEEWPYKIYFTKLVTYPRNVDQITIPLTKANTLDEQIQAVIKDIFQMEEFTLEEALNTLRTLSNLKMADNLKKDNINVAETLTDEQLKELNKWIGKDE